MIAVLLSFMFILSIIAGCGRGSDDDGAADTPEFIYVPEVIDLPDDITEFSNLTVIDDKVFFSSFEWASDSAVTKLFSMNPDGTGLNEISSFTNVEIIGILAASGDNLWVAETGDSAVMRKIDKSGMELSSINLSDAIGSLAIDELAGVFVDDAENIYIADRSSVFVLNNSGSLEFRLDKTGEFESFVRLNDGTIAFVGWIDYSRGVRLINTGAGAWGEDIELSGDTFGIFSGSGSFKYLYGNISSLFGVDVDTNKSIWLLDWINSEIAIYDVESLYILPDGRIICAVSAMSGNKIVILTSVPYDSVPHKTNIILATIGHPWDIIAAISDFNKNNPDYRIVVVDYSVFNTDDDYNAGYMRLSTEIIAGNIPDIIVPVGLPIQQYISKGLLEDLKPYIDSDPELAQGGLFEAAIDALKYNDGIYSVFSSFFLFTIFGSPDVLGETPGWTVDEFLDVLDANPNASYPLGVNYTALNFVMSLVNHSKSEFINWSTGEVFFDTGTFERILEYSKRFPQEMDMNLAQNSNVSDLVARGEQIMVTAAMTNFDSILGDRAIFRGDIVYKGYPKPDRNGNKLSPGGMLAMSSESEHKDLIWQFMRSTLLEDYQRENIRVGFPTNTAIFNEKLLMYSTPDTYVDDNGNEVEISRGQWIVDNTTTIELFALSESEVKQVLSVMNNISAFDDDDYALTGIVEEGASDFLGGRLTARAAAEQIQNRVKIYVAEQR